MNQLENGNKPVISEDGSHTLFNKRFGEHYHSSFGAIQESKHIFIQAALHRVCQSLKSINLFEVGFGTGLNALLAYKYALENRIDINYFSVEPFPISISTAERLNYPDKLNIPMNIFLQMHSIKETQIAVSEFFNLTVYKTTFQDVFLPSDSFNVVFFDAFSPESQPEMWGEQAFSRLFKGMRMGGVLTTYSSKGIVKRAMKSAGFDIEKLPGPPGKREFVRAVKG